MSVDVLRHPAGAAMYYEPKERCGWIIPVGSVSNFLSLEVTFNTESCCDFIRIYSGPSDAYTLMASLSGSGVRTINGAMGTDMFVSFTSDYSVQLSGFTINITRSSINPTVCPTLAYVPLADTAISFAPSTTLYSALTCMWVIPSVSTNVTSLYAHYNMPAGATLSFFDGVGASGLTLRTVTGSGATTVVDNVPGDSVTVRFLHLMSHADPSGFPPRLACCPLKTSSPSTSSVSNPPTPCAQQISASLRLKRFSATRPMGGHTTPMRAALGSCQASLAFSRVSQSPTPLSPAVTLFTSTRAALGCLR